MPITWRNVAAPESYSGNQLMNQGANRMSEGLGQLAAFGQQEQGNNIAQQNTFEQEQAQAFEQQLMGMDDTQVMALQEQFQSNPEAAQQQFGSQAGAIFDRVQQEPARREEQANMEFQRQQQTMARTTAPVLDRGRSELAAFNMDPTNPDNRQALNTTIQELEDMGAHAQVAEMRQMKMSSMNEQELKQRDQNLRGLRTDVNRFQQQALQGNLSEGDFLKKYDSLVAQYGEDIVSEAMPYNAYNEMVIQTSLQAGRLSTSQASQLEGINADVEYYKGRVNEEFEAQLADIERLSPDNYYASLNDEARQGGDPGAVLRDWKTTLEGQGIGDTNAGEYSRFAQQEAESIFNETLKEQTGLTQVPGTLIQRALNSVDLDSRWIDRFGTQDKNKARITDAIRREANNYLAAEQMTQRKNEAQADHRRRLQALREESRTVSSRLTQELSGDMNKSVTPELLQQVMGETQVMAELFNRRRAEEGMSQPENTPDTNQVPQESGPAFDELRAEREQSQVTGAQTPESALWDNENRSLLGNIGNVAQELFNLGPGNVIQAIGEAGGELRDQGTLARRNLTATGAEREQQLNDYREWVSRTGNIDVGFAEWLRSQ